MNKYMILYKNGRASGKCNDYSDVPAVDCVCMIVFDKETGRELIYKSSINICPSSTPQWFVTVGHLTKKPKPRTPNPKSKTKKQKKFEAAFLQWCAGQFAFPTLQRGSPQLKAYKRWLYEQKKMEWLMKPPTDKDGFIPWSGGECPVPEDTKVVVKFRNGGSYLDIASVFCWYEMGSYGDIVGYKMVEAKPSTIPVKPVTPLPEVGDTHTVLVNGVPYEAKYLGMKDYNKGLFWLVDKQPIKTTYTFWLGASGEIIDDK